MTGKGGEPTGKKFYRMGEVCEMTELEPHVLRFWESEFSQLNPKKSRSGHRTFTKGDIDVVFKIKRLLHEEGFTIAGAQKKLTAEKGAATKAEQPMVQRRVKEEIGEVKSILNQVLKLLDHP